MYLSLNRGSKLVTDRGMGGVDLSTGPVFGPIEHVSMTYSSIEFRPKHEEIVALERYDECVYYDGRLYSDINVLDSFQFEDEFSREKARADFIRIDADILAQYLDCSSERVLEVAQMSHQGPEIEAGRQHLNFPAQSLEPDDEDFVIRAVKS
ncbi:MAG: hypothetical protein ABEN55_21045 [Bradymonadaceae bacterium]